MKIHLLSETADLTVVLNVGVGPCEVALIHIDILTSMVMTQVLFIQAYC